MLMGSIFRSLLILIFVMAIGCYLFYLKTGSFPLSPSTFFPDMSSGSSNLRRLSEMPALNSVEPPDDVNTIHKWQDENGNWNFSNQQEK
tara:strand:- start:2632 stop:2898 length:267 start_codon:yes stop_codon:yes gene_type:complete